MPVTLTIPQEIEDRIFATIGYPVITENDLEVSFDFLRQTAIWPAMKEYFKYFPVGDREFYTVSGNFEIAFPNADVFGVTDARVHAGYGYQGTAGSTNPFVAEMYIRQDVGFGNVRGRYGTQNDYGMSSVIPIVEAANKTRQSQAKRSRVKADERKRKVIGWTNTSGKLEVQWAETSTNWDDIKSVYEEDVIDFSSANIMMYLGRLRGQEQTDLPVQFDAQDFVDTGREMKTEILERWRAATKVSITRK